MRRASLRAALVALVLALATTTAQAVVVYSGIVNINIPNTFDGLFLNVVTGSTYTGPGFPTVGGAGANYDINPFGSTTWSFFSPGSSGQDPPTPVPAAQKGYVAATTSSPASNLAAATLIGPASVFNSGTPSGSLMATGSQAFLGFRFRNEAGGSTTHYGWARMTLTNGVPGTLIDYAYDSTANEPIAAGAGIPEPTTLSLLAIGAMGMLRRRRA